MSRSPVQTAALTLLCFLAGLLCACQPEPEWRNSDVTGMLPDLEFSLVGEQGQTVTAQEFRGQPVLLFFGFTHCRGACPATLGQARLAFEALGEAASEVNMLLVSVDPERDSPAAMQEYTQRFGPWLHGLTGPEAALRSLNEAYKVTYEKLAAEAGGDYEVMHSSAVYAFDGEGRCRLIIWDVANTDDLVADLRNLIDLGG